MVTSANQHNWTEERVELLKQHWGLIAAEEIADKIGLNVPGGITKNSVIGKAHRIGLPLTRPSPKRLTGRPKSAVKRKYVRQVGVQGRHGYVKKVILREPVVEIIDSEIPLEQRRNLLQLGRRHCRYPVGDTGDSDFFFCGGPAMKGSMYCIGHHQRCHRIDREGGLMRLGQWFR